MSARPIFLMVLVLFAAGDAPGGPPLVLESRPASPPYLNLPRSESGAMPPRLSQTGAFADVRSLTPAPGLIPYDLIVPFWSDGAAKRRWIALPGDREGQGPKIRVQPDGAWHFPPGTVFVKHFEIEADDARPDAPRRLETRLLAVGEDGVVYGASYRWRPDNSDADLVREGQTAPINMQTAERRWYFPGPADCRQCHSPAAGGVLGVKARQLNAESAYPGGVIGNQLRAWTRLGLLEPGPDAAELGRIPRLARIDDRSRSLEDRARSYLDANCSHCHRPGGAAADFDARYETPLAQQKLIGEPARINLGIDGARFLAPNDPWRSLILARVETLEATKMPPLAHEVLDRDGAELLRAWIASLPGPPVVAPPAIAPPGGESRRPVRVVIRHDDPAAEIRYTLDGTPPGKSSPVYAGPIDVDRSTTLRARAYQDGHKRSIAVQETWVIGD